MAAGRSSYSYEQRNNELLTWTVSWKAHQSSGITRAGDIKFLLLGVHRTQDLGCPTGLATNEYPTTFCSDYTRMQEHPQGAYSERLRWNG